MTKKYIITIAQLGTVFRATYTNGKLKRIEHQRGKVTVRLWKRLTKLIPYSEELIPIRRQELADRITYDEEVKQTPQSLYSQFMGEYFKFYEDYSKGIPPKITGAEGKALKQVIAYLTDISATDAEALEVWRQIFANWDKLDEFYQQQIQIRQINSNLNTLIIQLKDGKPSQKSEATANSHANDLRQSL